MSGETLRQGAAAIHEDQPGRDDAEREFYLAVADWLESMAARAEAKVERHALAVARAYLGES